MTIMVNRYKSAMFLDIVGAFVGALFVAVWTIGQMDESAYPGTLDYIVEPPAIPGWVIVTLGVVGLVALVAIAFVTRHHPKMPAVFILSTVAGLLGGGCYRVITAGGSGANIGGAAAIYVGIPVVVVLLIVASVIASANNPDRNTPNRSPSRQR